MKHKSHRAWQARCGSVVELFLLTIWVTVLASACSFRPASDPIEAALPAGQSVSEETAAWMLKQARSRLSDNQWAPASKQSTIPPQATESRPATLFVAAFKRGYGLRPADGTGGNLFAALKSALDAFAASMLRPRSQRATDDATPDRIQIDILDGNLSPIDKPGRHAELAASDLIDAGVEGLAVEAAGRVLYLLPFELIYQSLLDSDSREQGAVDLLNRAMVYLGFEPSYWRSPCSRESLSSSDW